MGFDELEPYVAWLENRGYRRETNKMVVRPADLQYYLKVSAKNAAHYYVNVRIYDHRPHIADGHKFNHPFGLAFHMRLYDDGGLDMERFELHMDADGLTLEAFEERCKRLYEAMEDIWPKIG